MAPIAITGENLPTKERILSVCAQLFLEKGYHKTTVADITRLAQVSNSSFQHFFRAKDGVLTEFVQFMYENQFKMARSTTGDNLPPVYVYAVETATQITLTELNENLREIYLEAYSHAEALSFINRATAYNLHLIFGSYQPEFTEQDFYAVEVGTAGMMRGYMAHPCNAEFPLEEKLRVFLTGALRVLKVPELEVQQVVAFVLGLDVRGIAKQVMQELFKALSLRYEFSFSDGSAPSAKKDISK